MVFFFFCLPKSSFYSLDRQVSSSGSTKNKITWNIHESLASLRHQFFTFFAQFRWSLLSQKAVLCQKPSFHDEK